MKNHKKTSAKPENRVPRVYFESSFRVLVNLWKKKLVKELGSYTEQQQQVCYLMRIGLTNSQIHNMTNLSRATVWRWVKKYDWVLETESVSR